MAITTRDGLIAAIAAGPTIQFNKGTILSVAGFFYTHFRNAGMPGTAGSAPASSGVALSRSTTGAIPIPTPSATSYFTSFEGAGATAGTHMLADRLVEFGGLVANVTTPQTVSAVSLPARATGAKDVELWLEVYAAGGATASASVTASYTNQDGTAGRTATIPGGIAANGVPLNRSIQFALQAGDTGVQSVQSLTFGTSTGTAGNVGLVLRRSLMFGIVPAAGLGWTFGWAETDLQVCPDDACLELITLATAASTGSIMGNFGLAQA